jgi:hypothetical protein
MAILPSIRLSLALLAAGGAAPALADDADDALPIQSVQTFDYDREMTSFDNLFTGIEYNPVETDTFFTALRSGEVAKWRDTSAAPLWTVQVTPPEGLVEGIAVSHDGRLLGVVGGPNFIRFYDTRTGERLPTTYHVGDLNPLPIAPHFTTMAFSPNGQHMAAGDANGNIYIWDVAQPAALSVLTSRDYPIKQLAFSQSGDFLVSATNVEVLVWNWAQEQVAVDLGHDIASGPFWAESTYLPPYERVMAVSTYHDVVLYELASREILRRYPLPRGDEADSLEAPLAIVADEGMTTLWRFNKQPVVERLDLESGAVEQAYVDATMLEGLGEGFLIPAYVQLARKPRTANQFVAGVMIWKFTFGGEGSLKMLTRLRGYRLPES